MHYYFHILTDHERIRDPDVEEFSSLDSARAEAIQSARDLIAEKLRCGRAVPSRWRIQIALEDETIVETVQFTSLLLSHEAPPPPVHNISISLNLAPRLIPKMSFSILPERL